MHSQSESPQHQRRWEYNSVSALREEKEGEGEGAEEGERIFQNGGNDQQYKCC